jgi:hypothetical protein
MPRLSLWRPNKTNDYNFFDRTISEQFTAGATDLYVHKYLGPTNQGTSTDYTQPEYDVLNPTNIQDLLFLENRDRTYDPNVYRLRGHYNVQNLDFDLSQFGLFLNNDIIFITVHYNDMIQLVGRKLMVGDVIELPHLLDYNPLKETIPVALKRFMQVTDANYASEGFSPTWFPHLWRIKCEPLVDSEEFTQILTAPIDQDTYLGIWDNTKPYPAGYVITYGDKNYKALTDVPVGTNPPDPTYWELDTADNLKDILATYNTNIAINNAALEEAARLVPKSGYNTNNLYIVPTYGEYSSDGVLSRKINNPAPPINVNTNGGAPNPSYTGTVMMVRSNQYKNPSPAIRIPKAAIKSIWDMTADIGYEKLDVFNTTHLETYTLAPERSDTNSGRVSGETILTVTSGGAITGPYGTADNTYATADANPELPGFTGTISQSMDYRADCDPAYQYIARSSPRSFGYSAGYMTGDGTAPNGFPLGNMGLDGVSVSGAGISFPVNPQVGDYFLRIDYFPQILYRWDGRVWIRISTNVRTDTGFTEQDQSLLSGFINDTAQTKLTNGTYIPERQPLSSVLALKPDPIPPQT